MELPRLVHDELLHKLDEPLEQRMAQVLHAAEVEIPMEDLKQHYRQLNNNSDEHTPLLKASPSGHHVVVVDT
ncbi:Multidrug/oligosaccharidyl-lipid/polysaccharide, partial [Globisporangium polare]